MITLARFSIEEVLPFAYGGAPPKVYNVSGVPFKVKMGSLRYQTFKKSLKCVGCGLAGDFFLLQYSPFNEKKVRLNEVNCLIDDCELCSLKNYKLQHRQPEGWEKPHFNLYHIGRHGGLVLMTKDHIMPKSKGGPDHINNLQTMCTTCNCKKSDTVPDDVMITQLSKKLLGATLPL